MLSPKAIYFIKGLPTLARHIWAEAGLELARDEVKPAHLWRVTKYDPKLRDENGHYQGDDWVMWQEISDSFNGKILTVEEYLRVEDRYVQAALAALKATGLTELTATEVSNYTADQRALELGLTETIDIKDGDTVSLAQIPAVIRAMLREQLGCRLIAHKKFLLYTGWDYYMYIGANAYPAKAIKEAKKLGLYVEEVSIDG